MLKPIEIQELLNKKYAEYETQIPNGCEVLGLFVTGPANYDIVYSDKDFLYTLVYLPGFETICTSQQLMKKSDDNRCVLIDLRYFYNAVSNLSSRALELIFSKFILLNKEYTELYKAYFTKYRDDFGHINDKLRILRAIEIAKNAEKCDNHFELYRILLSCRKFEEKNNLFDCYHKFTDDEALNLIAYYKGDKKIEDMESYYNELNEIYERVPDRKNFAAANLLREGLILLLAERLKKETRINRDPFLEKLSNGEKQALLSIIPHINNQTGEGIIKISNLSDETGISLITFRNLINKLKEDKQATITNSGHIGTKFKFRNKKLLD